MPPLIENAILIAFCVMIFIVFLHSTGIFSLSSIGKKREENKKETKTDELVQYLFSIKEGDVGIYRSILNLIDEFIDEALNTYFKLEAMEEDHYITREESTNISKYILASISKNMTPNIIHSLKLVYNVNTDEELTKFLKLRIKLRMIDLIVNVNKPIE